MITPAGTLDTSNNNKSPSSYKRYRGNKQKLGRITTAITGTLKVTIRASFRGGNKNGGSVDDDANDKSVKSNSSSKQNK